MTLTHKVALVTGAASGIGRATALALAKAGADVAVNDISPRVEAVAAEIRALGRQAWAYPVDVTDQDAVEAMVASLPRVDIFVSSAVFSEREPFTTANMAGFRKTIDVSMWGAYYALRAASNRMLAQGDGGAAVIVSSPHGQIAFPNCMAYNMAKAALDMMMKTAATELLPHKIRVNCIAPSLTRTPLAKTLTSNEQMATAIGQMHALQRLGEADDIAAMGAFLMSSDAGWITGQIIGVDGGRSMLRTKG